MDRLDTLEAQSIYILREAYAKFDHLGLLWSLGKDSNVMVWLAKKAFFGHMPFHSSSATPGRNFRRCTSSRKNSRQSGILN